MYPDGRDFPNVCLLRMTKFLLTQTQYHSLTKQTLKPHFSQHSVVVVLSPKQDSSVEFVLTYLKIDFQISLQFDSNYPEG